MKIFIENDFLQVIAQTYGAELLSITEKRTGREFYVPGSETGLPTVLFPNVAMVKEDTIYVDGRPWKLQGGLAKNREFSLLTLGKEFVEFQLTDDVGSREQFPYSFVLRIRYELKRNMLRVLATVENPADTPLHYELGFHPAYVCDTGKEIYHLCFAHSCTADRFIRPNLLTEEIARHFLEGTKELSVDETLFANGTVALTNATCKKVTLTGLFNGSRLTVDGSAFRNICFYSPGGKPVKYISIELWDSDPEYADTTQNWPEKRGIHTLMPGEVSCMGWSLTISTEEIEE